MADSEQMKGVDSSHGAGKLQVFFKCRASIWFQMITEKKIIKRKKAIRAINYKDIISGSRSLWSQKSILGKHHYIFDLFFFSSLGVCLVAGYKGKCVHPPML